MNSQWSLFDEQPTTTQRLTLKEESSHKQVMNSGINNMALYNNMAKCESIKSYIIVFVSTFSPKFYWNIPVMNLVYHNARHCVSL